MSELRFLRIKLAYDGRDFVGWQVQPGQRSVQDDLQRAWRAVTGESTAIAASGRTDSGVHALGQVCGVATASTLACDALRRALNAQLAADVRVLNVDPAPAGFDPVRDALRKTYRYVLQSGRVPHLFWRHYAWYVPGALDVEAMRSAAKLLIGEHDFASFQTSGSARRTTVRHVQQLIVRDEQVGGYPQLHVEITANGFLYNMARSLVGTLVWVGRGKRQPAWVAEVLAATDRRRAGPTAPGYGLYLVHVEYDF